MREDPLIVILYEDSGDPRRFGPHQLLCTCVADEIRLPPWQVEHVIEAIPKKSNSKLVDAVERDFDDLCANGRLVVAVLDNDEARRLLDIEKSSCRGTVLEAFTLRCGDSPLLKLVLLEENTESILTAIADTLSEVPEELRTLAIERKKPNHRDTLCRMALGDAKRDARDRVRTRIGSFDRLVRLCVSRLRLDRG